MQPISVSWLNQWGEGIEGGGGGADQAAQRGREIQPISVSLFSGGGGGGLPKLLSGDKKYNLYL